MKLQKAITPAYLKLGFFGGTGTGKTWTACKVLSQFIAEFAPDKQLAMFDTEPAAGYVAPLVKRITGKELLAVSSRSFSDLLEFAEFVRDEGHVAVLDSATHPWRSLCADYLEAKKSRVKNAGGREETVRLTVKDWGPIKDMWGRFTEHFVYDPVHWCICGREGDVWENVVNDEGNKEMQKTDEKMKTETETGYEPSLLVQMLVRDAKHYAYVRKDRFDAITGLVSKADPDIEFFRPHLALLAIGGKPPAKGDGKPVFTAGTGPNWETLKARREGLLENIKDDLLLMYPGQTVKDKQAKVRLLRKIFDTSSWTQLSEDEVKFPLDVLADGREKLQIILGEMKSEEGA